MRVGTVKGTVWLVAALWLLASCVSAVAASGGQAQRDRAHPLDRSRAEGERAAPIPSSAGCQKVGHAPRIRVDLAEGAEFDFEGAAIAAKAIMRATEPGLCTFAHVHDPDGLREALAGGTYELTTVAFRDEDLMTADVYLEVGSAAPAAPVGSPPPKWRVGFERASDAAPWHVVSAVAEH